MTRGSGPIPTATAIFGKSHMPTKYKAESGVECGPWIGHKRRKNNDIIKEALENNVAKNVIELDECF